MEELFNGASITVDGVVFSGFGDAAWDLSSATVSEPDWSMMPVTGQPGTNPGLLYEINWEFLNNGFADQEIWFSFSFNVDTSTPRIFGDSGTKVEGTAEIDPDLYEFFEGTVEILEEINGGAFADFRAFHGDYNTNGVVDVPFDGPEANFPTRIDSLSVKTNALITAVSEWQISLKSFTQNFSVDPAPAPEPATFFLLGGGLAALGWMRRRRNG